MSSPNEEDSNQQNEDHVDDDNFHDAEDNEYNMYFVEDDDNDDDDEDDDNDDYDYEDEEDNEVDQIEAEDSDDDYETAQIPAVITYNTELASNHDYLGQNFQEISSSKLLYEINDIIQIPLLVQPSDTFYENDSDNSVQLIPGQVMPIYFYNPIQIQVIRRRLNENNPTIGFPYNPKIIRQNRLETNLSELSEDLKLGILAEVISASYHNENNEITDFSSLIESAGGLILKVKGRERFQILKLNKDITGTVTGTVKILPEYVLDQNPLSRKCHKNLNHIYDCYFHKNSSGLLKSTNIKAEYFNTFLNQPAWIYRNSDCNYLMHLIKKELNETFKINFEDPESKIKSETYLTESNNSKIFCSWLLTNFPFDNSMRITILKMNCINQRLSFMYSLLTKFTNINCRLCNEQFCTKSDVFSMSKHGFMGAYLNPGGVVHETLTVYKLKNFHIISPRPSTQHSWFPGYAWQIITCGQCNNHIGWKFTNAKPDLKPEKFFGLTRKAIRYAYRENDENDKNVIMDEQRTSTEVAS
ncbi:unnamed protein product [Brachionus calyciflorus]|uniref:Protein cereblon n=1 Tax=Brachionus calyciflorus TaxID=104777 RepID=A0A813WH85_9BILA|nr:unnamed protein product [Brachionus calyciflorus]